MNLGRFQISERFVLRKTNVFLRREESIPQYRNPFYSKLACRTVLIHPFTYNHVAATTISIRRILEMTTWRNGKLM